MANHAFYPEMGEQSDDTKLFVNVTHIGRSTYVKCRNERATEARAILKGLRIRPRWNGHSDDGTVFQLTNAAWAKLSPLGVCNIQMLL